MIDRAKIERFLAANEISNAEDFQFIDADGNYASRSKKPYVFVNITLLNGETFKFTAEEFESFGDIPLNVGRTNEDLN